MMTEEVYVYCLHLLYRSDLSYVKVDKEILPRQIETILK
jgi:hypothetical protein